MRFVIAFFILLTTSAAFSQQGLVANYLRLQPTSLPSKCALGDIRMDSATNQVFFCNNSNGWSTFFSTGALSLGAFDSQSPTATGQSLLSNVLYSQSADATHPGLVNTTTQSFAGQKTFSTGITGALTGNATTASALSGGGAGYIPYQSGSNTTSFLTAGTSGQALLSGGTGAPTWGSVLSNPMTTGGDIIYGGTSGIATRLANGSSGQVLTSNGGTAAPTWQSAGTASPLTTKGDLYGFSTVNARLPVGTDGFVLTADSTQTTGLKWNAVTGTGTVTSVAMTVPSFLSVAGSPITGAGTLAVTLSGTALPIANGGTGATSAASAFNALSPMTTGGDLIYGGASGAGTRLANGSSGQVLTSGGGTAAPTWTSLAAKGTGEVFMTAATTCPSGSIAADGSSLLRSGGTSCGGGACANLFTAISTTYGSVDGTHFTLPNLKGVFVRGAGSQTISSVTYSGTQGTTQGDSLQGHIHQASNNIVSNVSACGSAGSNFTTTGGPVCTSTLGGPVTDGTNGTPRTGTETKPANVVLLYCIVY